MDRWSFRRRQSTFRQVPAMLKKVTEMLQGFAKLLRTQGQGHWFLQLPLLRPYSQGRRVILDGLRPMLNLTLAR